MATRLQSDEAGKESKWADIDDDEDDWAPDTVEWMDGTKSSVDVASKPVKPIVETNKPSKPMPDFITEAAKPLINQSQNTQNPSIPPALSNKSVLSSQLKSATSLINNNKTVLKPGSQPPVSSTQVRSGGLVLKASTEKPSLTVKQSAPPPTKSPWAPLPPISKVSPVAINPPVQTQQLNSIPSPTARFGQRDSQGLEAMPPPSPAREIAADDFNRSWRDDRGNKELYNSQSGRYEPVNSRRRSSARIDQAFRQPAVLQRPSLPAQSPTIDRASAIQPAQDMDGIDRFSRSRRRASSNMSGGSFSQLRRPSITVPDTVDDSSSPKDLARKISGTEHARVQTGDTKLKGSLSDRVKNYVNGQGNNEQPPAQYGESNEHEAQSSFQSKSRKDPEPQQPNTDYVSIQRQVMREKTELARARKREEEEKEEAAKKERIRLKLEALGVQPSEQQEQKQDAEAEKKVIESSNRQIKRTVKMVEVASASSPPKPPIPTSVGEVAQYGMMKVHQPQPLRKAALPDTHGSDKQSIDRQHVQHLVQPSDDRSRLSRSTSPGIGLNQPSGNQSDKVKSSSPTPKSSIVDHWKQSKKAADSLNGWTNSSVATHSLPSSNVWGAPNTLGNGTFDGGYGRMAPRPLQHQQHMQSLQSTPPGPIAPPSSSKGTGSASQTGGDISTSREKSTARSATADTTLPHPRDPQLLPDSSEQRLTTPDASTSRAKIALPRTGDQTVTYGLNAWKNLPLQLRQSEKEERERLGREYGNAPLNDLQKASFKETFIQTGKAVGTQGKRSVIRTEANYHDSEPDNKAVQNGTSTFPGSKAPQPDPALNNIVDGLNLRNDSHLAPANSHLGFTSGHPTQHHHGRPLSRFFPRSPENVTQIAQVIDPNAPPPPDQFNHPAYAGDNQHPVVHLPIPKAVVKLPPPTAISSPKTSQPVPLSTVRLGSQPIVNQTAWQNRFDDLLNRKHAPISSPPKVQAYTVTSASKAPLDVSSQRASATVSLPSPEDTLKIAHIPLPILNHGNSVVSKPILEDLAEPLPFASTPPIRLPKAPFMNSICLPFPFIRYIQQPVKPQTTSIITSLYFLEDGERTPSGFRIQIRLPGREGHKSVILPVTRLRQPSYGRRKSHGKPKDAHMSRPNFRTMKAVR